MNAPDARQTRVPASANNPARLARPQIIESNISPIEDRSNGTLVVDGSIPHAQLGLINGSFKVKILNGKIVAIDEDHAQGRILKEILDKQRTPTESRVLAEFGVGLNPFARVRGNMLEDEGALGTIHLGFGSNFTVGGKNKASSHLDFVIRNPTVKLDERVVISNGKLMHPFRTAARPTGRSGGSLIDAVAIPNACEIPLCLEISAAKATRTRRIYDRRHPKPRVR